jgi:hypothetical protein
MLNRTRIGVTNGGIGGSDLPLMRLFKRGARYLRRKVTGYSHEEWSVMFRPRRLKDRDKIYRLIDERLEAFYSIPPQQNEIQAVESETAAILQQLARIAAQFESLCGRRPDKLINLIHRSQHSRPSPKAEASTAHGSNLR